MGNIVLNGATSGSTTVQPTDAVTATLTLPSTTGTLALNGPAFGAYQSSGQSLASGVFTKITFDVEEFDTNNNFASSKFTPTVAGYYQINASFCPGASGSGTIGSILIYKNGSAYKYGNQTGLNTGNTVYGASCLIYMNGSTDYLEIYGLQASGGTQTNNGGQSLTWFNGFLARTA